MTKKSNASKNIAKSKEILIRYEFSDESGRPEGGDILQFSSIDEIQEFVAEIIEVAQGDRVALNLTIGTEKSFKGFLSSVGLTTQDIENEMVPTGAKRQTAKAKSKKKASAKKAAALTQKRARK